jgi:hypothetical protein
VIQHPKTLPPGNPFLQRLQPSVFEFLDLPAALTDQVVVVLPFGAVFKPGRALSEPAGGSPPAFRQKAQGAIDRGVPDPRVLPANPLVEFIDRNVRPRFPEGADDLIPLAGGLEAPFAEELAEGDFGQWLHGGKN